MHQKFPQIALIGNPNAGKSTIFNLLTGKNQKTGNWSGVTIDKKYGFFKEKGKQYQILDLPGIYSLDSAISKSEDEKISQKNIIENEERLNNISLKTEPLVSAVCITRKRVKFLENAIRDFL